MKKLEMAKKLEERFGCKVHPHHLIKSLYLFGKGREIFIPEGIDEHYNIIGYDEFIEDKKVKTIDLLSPIEEWQFNIILESSINTLISIIDDEEDELIDSSYKNFDFIDEIFVVLDLINHEYITLNDINNFLSQWEENDGVAFLNGYIILDKYDIESQVGYMVGDYEFNKEYLSKEAQEIFEAHLDEVDGGYKAITKEIIERSKAILFDKYMVIREEEFLLKEYYKEEC